MNNKIYDLISISLADFDFDYCSKKEILTKMLENQKPVKVQEIDFTGSCCDFEGEYYDEFTLSINGFKLDTSTISYHFIDDFLWFLLRFCYEQEKTLVCPFEWEGQVSAFITTPKENGEIRLSAFKSRKVYENNKNNKFEVDILINKETFLKQIKELLDKICDEKYITYFNRFHYISSQISKYLENKDQFIKDYCDERNMRVYDIAYKTPENNWEFYVCSDNEDKSKINYWQIEKNEGKILDYDFFEQDAIPMFEWNEDFTEIVKRTEKDLINSLKTDMEPRVERNWVLCSENNRWYSENELMPYPEKIRNWLQITDSEVIIDINRHETEDIKFKLYVDGYTERLNCRLLLELGKKKYLNIDFDYIYKEEIRNALNKVKNGEYARFNLTRCDKLHIWQYLTPNAESSESKDIAVSCYRRSFSEGTTKIFYFNVDKEIFVNIFLDALDEIKRKIEITKEVLKKGKKLKIYDNFSFSREKFKQFRHIDNFKGDYACVYYNWTNGWGIINKNFEWVIKPESQVMYGEDSEFGREFLGAFIKYTYLHNIDGKHFIAANHEGKQFVIDINGNILFPHVRDKIYYQFLNDKLYFLGVDYDKTYIFSESDDNLLSLDFPISDKFWLFDEIIILSKEGKFGIVDWNGNIICDFIFSEIAPEKDNLDLIPVRYLDISGFIDKTGKLLNFKLK